MTLTPKVTTEMWAYLAGFIDGDGSISFVKSKRKNPRGYAFHPRLSLVNTNSKLIEIYNKYIQCGTFYQTKAREYNCKPMNRIAIQNMPDIEKILGPIVQFMIIRKKQAELILEFIKLRKGKKPNIIRNPKNGQILGTKIKEYSNRELEIYKEVCKLNERGLLKNDINSQGNGRRRPTCTQRRVFGKYR